MRTVVVVALLALSFTTGFTCSKNTPTETVQQPAQEEMAAPQPTEEMAPAEGAPSEAPMEGAPPPVEGSEN